MEEEKKQTHKEEILSAIKHGQVKMRPKWHFALKAALLLTGILVVFLALIYVASFILFTLHETGIWFIPIFGSRGWFAFFRSLPWVLIMFALVFILILEVLVRRYSFAYRQPLLYSAIMLILLVLVGAICMAPLHSNFARSVRSHHLPFATEFYGHFEDVGFDDIHKGIITAVAPGGFILSDPMRGSITVYIASSTRLPYGDGFTAGDMVVVFGDTNLSIVNAYGVQKISE